VTEDPRVAYFSMEVAFEPGIPTYAGGLGILAGDTLRSAADLGMLVVGVTLVHRAGYLRQEISAEGRQIDRPSNWHPAMHTTRLDERVSVLVENREVRIGAWRYDICGESGFVPVFLLDTNLPENAPEDRTLTDDLYGGDQRYRLAQEIILGVGGVRMLRRLGWTSFQTYHMNEGHAAFVAAELLRETALQTSLPVDSRRLEKLVRDRCVFTTHTPVAAGHDQFPAALVRAVAGHGSVMVRSPAFLRGGTLDMTRAALTLSRYANAVSMRHAETMRRFFPEFMFDAITNGVHHRTWVHPAFASLYDRVAPGWRTDPERLSHVAVAPSQEVWEAHQAAKRSLIERVNRHALVPFDADTLTLGIARRCTPYKRLDLIFADMSRLRSIACQAGALQIVLAGKAHPKDHEGKELVAKLNAAAKASTSDLRIAFLPDYGMETAMACIAGCDVWVNVPHKPLEASGTSGMKAAMNCVPSLSVIDGWWVEGWVEGETGWAIGNDGPPKDYRVQSSEDATSLYAVLESKVVPLFRTSRSAWVRVMINAAARNAPRFSSHRMVKEYAQRAWASGVGNS
jgi:starch phosphorylase